MTYYEDIKPLEEHYNTGIQMIHYFNVIQMIPSNTQNEPTGYKICQVLHFYFLSIISSFLYIPNRQPTKTKVVCLRKNTSCPAFIPQFQI